jgi:two-component system uhpT operon response regulator UhpA
MTDQAREHDTQTAGVPAATHLGALRVAIVDDHRMFLEGLQRSLADTPNLRVVAAVPSWPQLVRHPAYPVDVVVLDLELKDGVPPAVKISSARAAGAAVVVVSSFTDHGQVRSALAAGARGYVPKSEPVASVVDAVDAAAAGEQYLTPALATALLADDLGGSTPVLSPQELRALTLYVSGLPLKSVARQMGVHYETAKSYLDRVRAKYAHVGRDARTKVELRNRAVEDGHLTEGYPSAGS